MKRVIPLTLAVAALVGCRDLGVQTPTDGPSAIIVDAGHNSGNGAFHWLPPSAPSPDGSTFGVFDPAVRPTVEICPLHEDASGVGGFACDTQGGSRKVVARFTPSEIDGASDHYHVKFDTKSVPRGLYRMFAMIGSTADNDIVLAELGIRDVGIGNNVACSTDPNDPVLCVSGEHQIKFRIDEDAICYDGPVLLDDTCAGGTLTSGGQSFVLNAAGVQGATPSGTQTELSLVFTEVTCEPVGGSRIIGLEDGAGFHAMQWALYAPCFQVKTSPVITNENIDDLLEGGLLTYEICFAHPAAMTHTQKERARLARMATDRSELQILASASVNVVGGCPDAFAAGFGAKIWNLARGLFHRIGGPFAPEPVYAARGMLRRTDFGVGGAGPKSFVSVVMPAVLENQTPLDLGIRSAGESIEITVLAKDDGGDLVGGNDVTFTSSDGDTFDGASQTTLRTDASGSVTGNWVLAADAAGQRTLEASCFPCGGDDPPVTGEDATDLISEYDNLGFPDNQQTIAFTATVLDLSISIPGNQEFVLNQPFTIQLCIGADVPGVAVHLDGRANNGTPTEIVPSEVTSPAVFDPAGSGCWTVQVYVTKSGGLRVIATLLDGDGNPIEVEESTKVNIKPK